MRISRVRTLLAGRPWKDPDDRANVFQLFAPGWERRGEPVPDATVVPFGGEPVGEG